MEFIHVENFAFAGRRNSVESFLHFIDADRFKEEHCVRTFARSHRASRLRVRCDPRTASSHRRCRRRRRPLDQLQFFFVDDSVAVKPLSLCVRANDTHKGRRRSASKNIFAATLISLLSFLSTFPLQHPLHSLGTKNKMNKRNRIPSI